MTFYPLPHLKVEHNYTGSSWQDFTADLASLQVTLRELSGTHTAALSFYRVNMDPSQSSATTVIKKGDLVRIHANNSALTLRKMATMRVKNVEVDIDLKAAPGRQNRVKVNLIGTGVAGVAGVGKSAGVDTIDELSNVITGAPYEIGGDGFGSGRTTPTGSYTEVSSVDAATELDQILLTRDGNPGVVAFEDPDGRIQIFDSAVHRTAAPALTITSSNYSDIDQTFDMTHIINVLLVRYFQKIHPARKPTRIVEHDVVFENAASIAKYGRFKKTVKVHKKSNFSAYATSVFARNADPQNVPSSVTIPITSQAALLPGYADGHFVGGKVNVTLPNGTTTYTCRISKIQHNIAPDKWTVQVFLRDQNVMHKPHGHSAARLTSEVANTPDGMVLNAHLDDGSVTSQKTAYPVIGKIGTTAPTTPKVDDLWIDTSSGNLLKRFDGTSWNSAQDSAISAAQSTANGKNKVTYSTLDPGAVANTVGDLWFTFAGTLVAKQWKGNGGTSWTQVTLTDSVIANLDAAKITSGFVDVNRLQASSIGVDKLVVGAGHNWIPNPGLETGALLPHVAIGGATASVVTTAGFVHSGTYSMRVACTARPGSGNFGFQVAIGGPQNDVATALPVKAGDAVYVEGWARGGTTATSQAVIYIDFLDPAGTLVSRVVAGTLAGGSLASLPSSAMNKVSGTVVTPTGAAVAKSYIAAANTAAGDTQFWDDLTMAVQVTGDLLVNGAMDAKTITGPIIQTDSTGNRLVIWDDGSEGIIDFYSGVAGETKGSINPGVVGGRHYIDFRTSHASAAPNAVSGRFTLYTSGSAGLLPTLQTDAGTFLAAAGGLGVDGGANIAGGLAMNSSSISGCANVTGTGNVNFTGDGKFGGGVYADTVGTSTSAANMRYNPGGGSPRQFLVNTSLSRFKLKKQEIHLDDVIGLLDVTPRTWYDREEWQDQRRQGKRGEAAYEALDRIPGAVAEDVEKHVPILANYEGGELQGIHYDRVAFALLPIIRDQRDQIAALTARLDRLEAR